MKKGFFSLLFLCHLSFMGTGQIVKPDNTFGDKGKVITGFGSSVFLNHTPFFLSDQSFIVDLKRASATSWMRFDKNGFNYPDFGRNGRLDFEDDQYILGIQDRDKIISGRYSGNSYVLSRYLGNGQLDPTFGDNGQSGINLDSFSLHTFAIDSIDGSLLLSGFAGRRFVLAKWNTDGIPDTSFGSFGMTSIVQDTAFTVSLVLVQQDGKIIVAGSSITAVLWGQYTSNLLLFRYLKNGEPDTTFGSQGIRKIDLFNRENVDALAEADQGSLIVSFSGDGANYVLRLDRWGQTDQSFGNDGLIKINEPYTAQFVRVMDTGKILVGGSFLSDYWYGGAMRRTWMYRYDWTGKPDLSFYQQGALIIDSLYATDYLWQDNGTITFSGFFSRPGETVDPSQFRIVQIEPDKAPETILLYSDMRFDVADYFYNEIVKTTEGELLLLGSDKGLVSLCNISSPHTVNRDFGVHGQIRLDFGISFEKPEKAILLPDNKILAVGSTNARYSGGSFDNGYLVLARYLENGALDTSFGVGGKVIDRRYFNQLSTAIYGHGRVLIPEKQALNQDSVVKIVAFNEAGERDDSFGQGGVVSIPGIKTILNITATEDQKYLITGIISNEAGEQNKIYFTRLQTNGRPDSTYGISGWIIADIPAYYYSNVLSVNWLPGNKAMALIIGPNDHYFLIIKYNPDGSRDRGFGNYGSAIMSFGGATLADAALYVQPDGKVILAGINPDSELVAGRLLSNGTVDVSFGTGGIFRIPWNSDNRSIVIAFQKDNKILISGSGTGDTDNLENHGFVMVRYCPTDGLTVPSVLRVTSALALIFLPQQGI